MTARATKLYLFSSLLLILIAVEYWISRSYFFNENPDLISLGIAIDITLGVPILFYFFIAKPRKYSALSLLPVFLASIALATIMLPADHQSFLSQEKKIVPFIEVAVVLYICFKIPGMWKRYKHARETEFYISDAFEAAAGDMMQNRLIKIVITEFLLMYLAFGGWFKKFQKSGSFSAFTYHQKSSYSTILGVMSFLMIVETVGLHFIIMHWSVITAAIITALSIYGLIWLIGDFHAIRLHPVILAEKEVLLRTGIRWRATIPISEIASVEIGNRRPRKSQTYLRASVLFPCVILHLHHPVPVKGLFGMMRHPTQIGLSIDDPERFKSEILKRQSS